MALVDGTRHEKLVDLPPTLGLLCRKTSKTKCVMSDSPIECVPIPRESKPSTWKQMANGRRTGSAELVGSAEPKNVSSRPLLWPVLTVRYYDLRTVNKYPFPHQREGREV
uniref:Uncharacterized protein K0023E10.40 n=1 Tax=Oryza sativa subsp. indica TaxID=39946 RepID=C8TEV5_ORYSI|nr:hypothetical protein [Oryza sativa Indica Group]BAI39968.1 hypothetical protein [Oryza sativa Indica Group]